MSSRPRRLVHPESLCLRSTLSSAAALVKQSLYKDPRGLPFASPKDHLFSPLHFPSAGDPRVSPVPGAGLTARDTLSRCLATPTASPIWQHRSGVQASPPSSLQLLPLAFTPTPSPAHLMAVLRSSSLLTSRVLEQQHASFHTAASSCTELQDRLRSGAVTPVSLTEGSRLSLKKAQSRHSSPPAGSPGSLSLSPGPSASLGPSSHRTQDPRRSRPLGPLLSLHALKAAASFHYLHGGLPDTAAFAPLAPADGRLHSRSSRDPKTDRPSATPCIASDTEAARAEDASGEGDPAEPAPDSKLRLVSGACALPHPDKVEKGGEDAFFISTACQAVGVADGVGGWADVGVDAGAYARELMSEALKALEGQAQLRGGQADPMEVLQTAHANTASQGSSTACVILLADQKLTAANLGDSGFMVIRSGRTIFKSPPQQHDFNFPYQLGSAGGDPPGNAEVYNLPVAPGDVIVLGTDGLFDNVFDGELASMVMHSLMAGRTPQNTAEHIAALARIRAADRVRFSPFARAAMEAGYRYYGGKMDDITVVVSYVTAGGNAK